MDKPFKWLEVGVAMDALEKYEEILKGEIEQIRKPNNRHSNMLLKRLELELDIIPGLRKKLYSLLVSTYLEEAK